MVTSNPGPDSTTRMHYRFFRDAFFGRIVYHISAKKFFKHPEEEPDYVIPEKYLLSTNTESSDGSDDTEKDSNSADTPDRNDNIYVTWNGDDDPENPQNWPLFQKIFFIFEIAFLTTSVYIGSAVYTPGIEDIMEEFNIDRTKASLPLTMFVIGYGLGPMVFSPMSENAAFGRTYIYIFTLFIFFILQIPTALATNIASLSVLRFLGGFFSSPALATGGASIVDVLSMPYTPVGIAVWSVAAVCGPSLGPLVGSVLTVKGGWRWTFWFMAIISGVSLVTLSFMLPETYEKTILLRKAKRLRAKTGNKRITTEEEVANSKMTASEVIVETLWRPFEITITEPVVLCINLYIALVYSILYLWFEAFPIAFLQVYNFTLVEMGVSYVSVVTGFGLGCSVYLVWIYKAYTKKLLAGETLAPEVFLPISIIGGVLMPIGIFIFGWTVAKDIHWIVSLIGASIFACGGFFEFQTLLNYLGMSFFRYVASVFAGNDLFRSVIAGVFPLFGHDLFNNLRTDRFAVGWGSTILGFLALFMLAIPILFYLNGPKLRARSKWAN